MSWNYRVVKEVSRYKDIIEHVYVLKEAFYDSQGRFNGTTVNPATVMSSDGIAGLRETLRMMLAALDKPVVEEKK